MELQHNFNLQCNCGCGTITINHDPEDETFLEYYELAFYSNQKPWRNAIRENLKLIWNIIRGKRYCFYEVVISKERWEEFKKFISET